MFRKRLSMGKGKMFLSKSLAITIAFGVNAVLMCILFVGIGIHSMKRTDPTNFWASTSVSEDNIKDVKAYNRENGILWISYGCLFALDGIIGIFAVKVAAVLLLALCIACVPVLLAWHTRIFKKYVIK